LISERNLSLSSDLVSSVWTEHGELTKLDKKKLKFWIASPLPSSSCELGFSGSVSESFFERISEALSKLPSLHEVQLIFDRRALTAKNNDLFPTFGLLSQIYIIEKSNLSGQSGMIELLEDLGLELRKGEKKDYQNLLQKFLGQKENCEQLILPDLTWE